MKALKTSYSAPALEKAVEIVERMLEVASGAPSKSEALGVGDFEFVPWQLGAFLYATAPGSYPAAKHGSSWTFMAIPRRSRHAMRRTSMSGHGSI